VPISRREKKKELTRSFILDAAAKLFAKKGYDATSIDDIVQSADLVKATFYYHFKSKEELVLELRKQSLMQDFASIHTALAAGASPLKVLAELFAKDAAWTEQNPDMARVFFSQLFGGFLLSATSDSSASQDSRIAPPIILLVDAAQKAGELRTDVGAIDMAEMIMGCFGQAQFTWLLGERTDSLVKRVRYWLDIMIDGLSAKNTKG
jgi:AcrR family transcriptional regulator